MTPESLTAKVETDVAKSLAQINSGDTDETSLRQRYPLARFRAPHPIFDLSCSLFSLSLASGATEVRITPSPESVDVQMKVNEKFEKAVTLPKALQEPIVARLKDAANLDVTEQEQLQAGTFPAHWQDKDFDVPVSIVPSGDGEQVIIQFVPT